MLSEMLEKCTEIASPIPLRHSLRDIRGTAAPQQSTMPTWVIEEKTKGGLWDSFVFIQFLLESELG